MATPEDILSSSLETLYSYTPVSFEGATYTHKSGLTVMVPDTSPSNWALHASSIWAASLFLADHIDGIIQSQIHGRDVLELGAGSGLPGILFAKRTCGRGDAVTLSDYPDEALLKRLEENAEINNVPVRVVGYAWGQSTTSLGKFDIVLAADTLWNSDQHLPFCQTLSQVLRRNKEARIYLVAGLHTGRWTIRSFLDRLKQFDLVIESLKERMVTATFDFGEDCCCPIEREWRVERDGEEENERRKWVVWIVVKWAEEMVSTSGHLP